jgi:hypothetical protein
MHLVNDIGVCLGPEQFLDDLHMASHGRIVEWCVFILARSTHNSIRETGINICDHKARDGSESNAPC